MGNLVGSVKLGWFVSGSGSSEFVVDVCVSKDKDNDHQEGRGLVIEVKFFRVMEVRVNLLVCSQVLVVEKFSVV